MADIVIQIIKGAITVRGMSLEGFRWLATCGYQTEYSAHAEIDTEDIEAVMKPWNKIALKSTKILKTNSSLVAR